MTGTGGDMPDAERGPSASAGPNQLSGSAPPNQLSTSDAAPGPAGPLPAAPSPPPPEPARRGFNWQGIALRVGIIAAIVVGGLILRDRLTGAATDLQVGDCFDVPAELGEVSEVQHQPCHDAHDAEVFFVADFAGSSYPVISGFDDFVIERCFPAFESYVGRSFEAATELDMSYFSPTLAGWGEGDREVTCYLVNLDKSKLTSSMKIGGG
jgi:hypothetical protein